MEYSKGGALEAIRGRLTHKTGILGGSFDPIHLGHTDMALAARESAGLISLLFMPLSLPPHKYNVHAAAADRLNMTELAIRGIPNASVSNIEISRGGTTYTVDTLKELARLFPGTEFFFIIGADTLLTLDTWKRFDEVSRMVDFICAARPGVDDRQLADQARKLNETYKTRIKIMDHAGLNVSSSEIRELVRKNKPIGGMVCPDVEQYILNRGLYRE